LGALGAFANPIAIGEGFPINPLLAVDVFDFSAIRRVRPGNQIALYIYDLQFV
jgi:hypothetical protein